MKRCPIRRLAPGTALLILSVSLAAIRSVALATPEAEPPAPTAAGDGTKAKPENGLETAAQALLDKIKENSETSGDLLTEFRDAEGEDRYVLITRMTQQSNENLQDVKALVANILRQDAKGYDTSGLRKQLLPGLDSADKRTRMSVQNLVPTIQKLRKKREEAPPEERMQLEAALAEETKLLDNLYSTMYQVIDLREQLGLDSSSQRAFLNERLTRRAEYTSGRVELLLQEIQNLSVKLKEDPENKDLKVRLKLAEERQERVTAGLQSTVAIMQKLNLPTAEYRQLMIQATGDITADIFDRDVALGLLGDWLQDVKKWAKDNGPRVLFKILLFLVIIGAFKILARITRRIVSASVSHSKLQLSQLLQNMFVSIASNSVMILGVLIALSQLGVELAPLLAGLGIAGFIVGFALQDVLGNFASGLMILIYRPFDVGDLVDAAGVFGKVSKMSLVSTTVLTFDNQTLVVPNSKIWGDVIKNVTAQRTRRVDMTFGISYGDDIPRTEKMFMDILKEHEKVLETPEPVVRLHTLNESSVDFIVRPWVRTEDYWDVYWDVTREVKMRCDREGISIPFPQRDVHLFQEAGETT